MLFLYNLGVRSYALAIRLASNFNSKASKFVSGRTQIWSALNNYRNSYAGEVAWFHAASLGEFEQGLPVMEAFKKEFPGYQIVVSFFSPSGYELRKDHPIADFTCYLPIDSATHAKKFLGILHPSIVFFIKYEYWYHHLNEVRERRIPLYSISALFTSKHIFFKPYGGFHRKMLQMFSHTFVQNSKSKLLLESIGVMNCSISGDTRFDRVKKTVSSPQTYPEIEAYLKDSTTFIAGSVWPEDMEVIAEFVNQNPGHLKVIIAPHLIEETHLKKITRHLKVPFQFYSKGNLNESKPVLILDTMGMLSSIYQYGDFAYIGGAFGDGLHNILEAVAFGLPVVFGNSGLDKFPESEELATLGGAFPVDDSETASEVLSSLAFEDYRKGASTVCLKYVEEKAGATQKVMSYLKKELK